MRWTIRAKILAILSILLLFAVAANLILAEKILREDKEILVFETSRSNAEQLANEMDGLIRREVEKMQFLSEFFLTRKELAQEILEKDTNLVGFRLFKEGRTIGEFVSQKKLRVLK